jgi:uncharacterized protein
MNIDHSARVALAALAGSLVLLGCAAAPPRAASRAAFDPQACAEEALRKHPDPSTVLDAAAQFSIGCTRQDPAACSMLGVMTELGLGMRRDRALAQSLYRRACEAGNMRGCGNLGELQLASLERRQKPAAAIVLLEMGCNAGHARPCGVLARAYSGTAALRAEPEKVASLFERACARGDVDACSLLAGLIERGAVTAAPARAAELRMTACTRGDREACAHLEPSRAPRPSPLLVGARDP